jgi:dolichol-phosphate mannosyltransferase
VSDSIVIIPTYNEKENIEKIIATVFSLPKDFHILIVDDGSPDGTADIVKTLQIKHQGRLHIEERKGKLGLGTAYIHGFRWALEKGYGFVFEMDADFSHPPHKLVELYEACKNGADMSVGSRYTKDGEVVNWPFDRILMSYGASLYVRTVTLMPVKDPTAGFVCYTSKVLKTLDLDKIKFIGYAFQIEMKFATRQLGFKIVEVPISFKDREAGISKMSLSIFKEAIFGVLKMRWWSFFNSYRKS